MIDAPTNSSDTTDLGESTGRRPDPRQWALVASAAVVALGLILWAVVSLGSEESSRTPAADSADAGFARDMAVHHQQAVEMAYIVRDQTGDEDIRRFAYDVAQTQANQRGMLLGWLDLWGLPKSSPNRYMTWMKGGGHMGHEPKDGSLMPGMATNTELDKFRGLDGKQAEVFYLQLMYDHHMAGVDMARACTSQCEVDTEKQLAQGMVRGQQSEMELMTGMLKERGATPR